MVYDWSVIGGLFTTHGSCFEESRGDVRSLADQTHGRLQTGRDRETCSGTAASLGDLADHSNGDGQTKRLTVGRQFR